MKHFTRSVLISLFVMSAAVTLSTCGGSSGSAPAVPPPPPPPPPPSNSAPTITSGTTASISENTGGVVYTATASDTDGDTVTFSFTQDTLDEIAVEDARLFDLDANSGAISFKEPPNFENPRDVNRGNDYRLEIVANDGTVNSAVQVVTISVTDVAESFRTTRVATLTQPIYPTALPDGSNRLVVIGKQGAISLLTPSGDTYTVSDFMDISGTISTNGERGLLGIAFSPPFSTDRTFYLHVTNLTGDTEIRRYQTMPGTTDVGDPSSGDVILTVAQPASNHNAGWIGFDESGLLYIPLGDGGGSGDPSNLSQDPNELLGKVLRIDVTGDDFPADDLRDYRIPGGNTFNPDGSEGRPEIYAIGLRNPFQSSVGQGASGLVIADVGQNAIEEINFLPFDDATHNFGWNLREGTQPFNGGADDPAFSPPVAEYSHGTGPTEGRSVTGGLIYLGSVQDLQNQYIFADFISNNIWSLPREDIVPFADTEIPDTTDGSLFTNRNDDFNPDAGSIEGITGFGTDRQNELFITTIGGDVFKIEP